MPATAVGGHLMHIIFVLFQTLILVILDGEQSLFLNKRERVRESYVVSVVFDSIKFYVGLVFQGQLHAAACHPDLHTVEKKRKNTVHHKT